MNKSKVTIYNNVLADISRDKPLEGFALRVFMGILGQVRGDNVIPSPAQMARYLKLQRSHTSRAYQIMVQYGYLIKDADGYKLHPLIGFVGSEAARQVAIEKLTRLGAKDDKLLTA